MLAFMPWCPIDREYTIGDIDIVPFRLSDPAEGQTTGRIPTPILENYKSIRGRPIDRLALVKVRAKELTDQLTDEEIASVKDCVQMACFCALSAREYFDQLGKYCSSDSFSLYFQRFTDTDFVGLTSRRREGRDLSGWPTREIAITVPVHCHATRCVSIDADLADALSSQRSNSPDWGRWQNAVSCYNWANTDSDNVTYQMEWVLLASAFEHLLDASPNAVDVAEKFSAVFAPSSEVLASAAVRRLNTWQDRGKGVRFEWMREFYRVRGNYAHGSLATRQTMVWQPLEHLVLATIAFPLVVKSLLRSQGLYNLSDKDLAQLNSFERFADTRDFCREPQDQRGSLDWHWPRLVSEARSELAVQRAVEAWRSTHPGENEER